MIRFALRVRKFFGVLPRPAMDHEQSVAPMRCRSCTVADEFKYSGTGVGGSEPYPTVCGPHLFPDPRRERALPVPPCHRRVGLTASGARPCAARGQPGTTQDNGHRDLAVHAHRRIR